jgi:hypothetical protein
MAVVDSAAPGLRELPQSPTPEPSDFSIVEGGALFQLLLRAGLIKPSLELLRRRVIVLTLIAWAPLLVLSVIAGRAWGNVKIPFLFDLDVHLRLLVSLPLLLFAETLAHQRMKPVISQFLERDIVPLHERSAFAAILRSTLRLRNSRLIELLIVVFVLTIGHLNWRNQGALGSQTWYADVTGRSLHLTLPGGYLAFVSVPLFQFILLRWYFRLFIWCQFLWRVSRLDLKLVPTHPDRAGGLGFLQGTAMIFAPLLMAHSVVIAGVIANRIFHEGAKLPMFKVEIGTLIAFLLVLVLAPLVVFVPVLVKCRRTGIREYGGLASRYVREFDQKWVRGNAPKGEAFIGTADLQSLADLGNSFDVIREMQILPFGRPTVIRLLVVILLPLFPLIFTMIPFEEFISRLLKALM